MKKMINKNVLSAKDKNTLYNEGFRFVCDGDFHRSNTMHHVTGMFEYENNVYAFDNKEEAEKFAAEQNVPYFPYTPYVFTLKK